MEVIRPKRRKTQTLALESKHRKFTNLENGPQLSTKIDSHHEPQSPPTSTKALSRVLKSCTRCRQHKTKCDAAERKPLPCSHCARKNAECVPEVVEAIKSRSGDVVELLMLDVLELRNTLDTMIDRKSKMIDLLVLRGMKFPQDLHFDVKSIPSPQLEFSDRESESDSDYEDYDEYTEFKDEAKDLPLIAKTDSVIPPETPASASGITATTIIELPPTPHHGSLEFEDGKVPTNDVFFSLGLLLFSLAEINSLFDNFRENFHKYIPIFPHEFLYDPKHVYSESDLLFWSIVGVSHLNGDLVKYLALAENIKSLVVEKCWYNTPRSVHTLLALLILTTWSLPNTGGDELSVTYLSLMRNLALQLGLHRLEFIDEFSHKTTVGISKYSLDNNRTLRDRIYKFISITSHHWYQFLGYPQHIEEDFIVSNACKSLLKPGQKLEDQYINSMLKLCSIQRKMAQTLESADNSITGLYRVNQTKRFINLGMFERILTDVQSTLGDNCLTKLNVHYLKLQLYLFAFSPLDKFKIDVNLGLEEYLGYVYKALESCHAIVELFELQFPGRNFLQVPVNCRFALELALLTMMRIFHSPLLKTTEEYQAIKQSFQRGFARIEKHDEWKKVEMNDVEKVIKTLVDFDTAFQQSKNVILGGSLKENRHGNRFFLIKRFKDHLVSSLQFEMSWFIHECQKSSSREIKEITWDKYDFVPEVVASLGLLIFVNK